MDQKQTASPYKGGSMTGWESGMDNRRSNTDIPSDTLRDVVNGDVLTSGKVRRRRGMTQRVADAGAHSVYSDGTLRILWATANTLKSCTGNFAPTTLFTDARLGTPLSYAEVNSETYFSNEQINGKIDVGGIYRPFVQPPAFAPICVSTDNSSVAKIREYQVTCTFVMGSGEETSAPLGVKVVCGESPIISMTSIPQSLDSRVVATRVYVTDIDGDFFYAQYDVPVGVMNAALNGPFAAGQKLTTQFMMPPPPGQLIAYSRGRMWIAVANILFFTEPLRYGLVDMIHGYIMYPERITLLIPVDDGLYLSSDQTYFLEGEPHPASKGSTLKQTLLHNYKAIEGASFKLPTKDTVVMWLSERGFIRAKSGGSVENITEDQIAMDVVTRACMGMFELNGAKHVVAIAKESRANPLVADDFTAGEAERITDLAA